MKNKNVFITGSSRGIGLGVAEFLGGLGARVSINCSKNLDELISAKSYLKGKGIEAFSAFGDVSHYETCEKVISLVKGEMGEIDVLINNAGISHMGLFTDSSVSQMRRIVEVNQFSVVNCCHIVSPYMIRKKEGRIINISSVWGVSGASCEVIYSASKGFVNTFTKALSKELAPSGVLVNAIALGVIDTDMNSVLTEEEKEALKDRIGLMRFGEAKDAAELCLYLAKTRYMTGQVLTLDGGLI